jgi:hypothetical protein
MATFNKFNDFVEQLGKKNHNLDTDTFRVMLTNEQPLAADTVKSDMAEISAGNGYTAGGEDIQNAYTESGGTGTMTAVDVTWTATGDIGPFRYAVIYNDTGATKYLLGWFDYLSSITLHNGETFKVDFNAVSLCTIGP